MLKLYRENELPFAIVCIVIYMAVFGSLRTLGDDHPAATLGLLVLALVLLLFVKNNGLMGKYGLDGWAKNSRQMLYFVPLWVISTGNLWGGFSPRYQGLGLVCAVVTFALVGFVEELLFRGLLFKAILRQGGEKKAIIISALTFGMGHIVNLFSGQDLVETLVQICFAVAIGFIFTMVYYKCASLWPLIVAHSTIDVLSVFGADNVLADWIYIGSTLVIAVLYCWYLSRLETPEANRIGIADVTA